METVFAVSVLVAAVACAVVLGVASFRLRRARREDDRQYREFKEAMAAIQTRKEGLK